MRTAMSTVLLATIRFSIEFSSRSSFVGARGAREEVSFATDKISVGNGQNFMF
jgi:hypothetical protein